MKSMKLLALDTSTEHISVSFYDGNNIDSINKLGDIKSSSLILPLINEVVGGVKLDNLDGIIYSKGPGAFTGVRVGVSVAQGLSLANNIPTLGFSSLQMLEFGAKKKYKTDKIVSAIDARMGEVYLRIDDKELLATPEEITNKTDYIGVGTGFRTYDNFMGCRLVNADFYPQAENLIHLALTQPNFNFDLPSPIYLRNNIAKKSVKS